MRKTRLIDFRGTVIGELPFPEKAEEVTYKQYIDFSMELNRCQTWAVDERNKKGEVDPLHYLARLANVCAEFWQKDKHLFDNLNLSSLEPKQAVDMESSILDIVNYLMMMTNYEPKLPSEDNYIFKHKGRTFMMPYFRASAFAKQSMVRPPLVVGEALFAMETSRAYNYIVKNHGDPQGSSRYTAELSILAVLAREPHIKLPDSIVAIDNFVKDQIHFFEDISMVPVRDMAFFLTTTRGNLNKSPGSSTSSIHRNERLRTNTNSRRLPKLRQLMSRFIPE